MRSCVLGMLLLGAGSMQAQTNRPIHYVPSSSLQSTINHLFAPLSTAPVSSGILMDKSANRTDASVYNGSINSSQASTSAWYSLYNQTRGGRTGSSPAMLSDLALEEEVAYHNSENRICLGLLFANYHCIKNPATATQGWFTYSGGQLHDVPGRTESPYQQQLLFAIAPLRKSSADGEVKFIVPSALSFGNRGAFTLQADWGKGAGYQPIAFNTEYPVIYSTVGNKIITIKLSQGGVDYYARSTFKVEQVYTFSNALAKNCPGVCYDALWTDVAYPATTPLSTAETYVIYANGRSHLQKPVIFVEGQDVLNEYNFKELFNALIDNSTNPDDPNVPLNQLINNGYDVLILNFKRTGHKSMRENAEGLRRLIKRVNREKQGNEKLQLAGISMGGVIARYTLAKMENVYCEAHNVGEYISYDAPHTGANIPLGLQVLTMQAYSRTLGLEPNIRMSAIQLEATSTLELLSIHESANGQAAPGHVSFYKELEALGMPQACRNIAFSNGNTFNNLNSSGLASYSEGAEILNYEDLAEPGRTTQSVIKIYVNAVNATATQDVLYLYVAAKIDMDFPWWLEWLTPDIHVEAYVANDHFPYRSDKPYDNSPGGYINTQQGITESLGGTTHGRNHHCIVPTVSAYAIKDADVFYNKSYSAIDAARVSPFDEVYASGNSVNFNHTILAPLVAGQLFSEFLAHHPAENSLQDIANEIYNITAASLIQRLPKTVNIKQGGTLQINCGNGSDYGSGPVPLQASVFTAAPFDCGTTVHIYSGGELQVGDGGHYGKLLIPSGCNIIVHAGGYMSVGPGSSVVLANGGSLVYEQGARIKLDDAGSVIELGDGSKIEIGSNATFSWTGDGYIKVNTPTRFVSNVVASGPNAKFKQRGTLNSSTNKFDKKLVEIVSGTLSFDKSISEVRLSDGIVLMGKDAIVDVDPYLFCSGVKFTSAHPGIKHGGLWVYGQQTNDDTYANNCTFEYATTGITVYPAKGISSRAKITSCVFRNCNEGINVFGKGAEIHNCTFWQMSHHAIGLSGIQNTCIITKLKVYESADGVVAMGSNNNLVHIKEQSKLYENHRGVFARNTQLAMGCSEVRDNIGVNIEAGYLSQLMMEPVLLPGTGNNNVSSRYGTSVNFNQASSMFLHNGNSDFHNWNRSSQSMTGSLMPLFTPKDPPQVSYRSFYVANNYWHESYPHAPEQFKDYEMSWLDGHGSRVRLIDDGASLSSAPVFPNCMVPPGGVPGTIYTGRGSVFIAKKLDLSNGMNVEITFMDATAMLYPTSGTPNLARAFDKFESLVMHSYGLFPAYNDADGNWVSEFQLWYNMIDLSYIRMIECFTEAVASGQLDKVKADLYVTRIIDAQEHILLMAANKHELKFRMYMDRAMMYRLGQEYAAALNILADVSTWSNNTDEQMLLEYYTCITSTEQLIVENGVSKSYYESDMYRCHKMLGMLHNALSSPSLPGPADAPDLQGGPQGEGGLINMGKRSEVATVNDSSAQFTVYPNPARDVVHVKIPIRYTTAKVVITDMIGKTVFTRFVSKYHDVISLNPELPAGTYFVELMLDDKVINRTKMMIVK